jgi:hypothetical protein
VAHGKDKWWAVPEQMSCRWLPNNDPVPPSQCLLLNTCLVFSMTFWHHFALCIDLKALDAHPALCN